MSSFDGPDLQQLACGNRVEGRCSVSPLFLPSLATLFLPDPSAL